MLTTVRLTLQPLWSGGARDALGGMMISITDGAVATRTKQATDAAVTAVDQSRAKSEREKLGRQTLPKF
jgi:hypothetical protein